MLKILQADGGQLPLDFDKYFIQEEMNGEDQIGFTLPLDHADYKQLAEEVQLLDAEDGQVYRITAIDEGAVTANIKGKLELSPLRADMRIPYTNGSDTLAGTVEGVLPAGWTVVDHSLSTIRRTIELDSATPEDVILGAASVFGGLAIRYKIADKSVHFYDPGDFKAGGVYLTEELNLTSTNFKGSSSGLCTRLYARGKDGLTFAGINGGKDYVENFSYTDKIICAYWEDERYTVAENLLEAAQKKVDASAVPVRSYSCGVVDLAKAWRYEEGAGSNIYAHLNIQLLTVATLLDTRRGTRIDHQVVQYKRYPHYPDLNVVTLSTKAPTITATVKQLQDAIENPSSSFRKQMQNLINQMAAGISGHDGGTMEITFNSEGKPNGIRWGDGDDLATSQKVLWLNLEGIAYGQNGVNGDYSTVWSFAQNGFVADWIVVGTITANLIKTGLLQSKNGKSWINLDTGAARLSGTFLSGTDAFLAEFTGGMLRFSQNGTYVGGLYSNTWGDYETLSFSGSAVHVSSRIDDARITLSSMVQDGATGEIKSWPSLMVSDGKGKVISLQIANGESKIIFDGYECTLKERTVDGQTIRYLGAL